MDDSQMIRLPVPDISVPDLARRVSQLEETTVRLIAYVNGLIKSQQIAEALYGKVLERTEHTDQLVQQINRRQKRYGALELVSPPAESGSEEGPADRLRAAGLTLPPGA